jgi:hypothetical protein
MAPTERDERREDDGDRAGVDRIPRIGRGRLMPRFPMAAVTRILFMIVALVFILSMRQACGDGVSNWFHIVAPAPPAAPPAPPPGR